MERGYWQPGDVLGDCFGGVALGGVVAAYHGLAWVGCELEPKFVALGQANIDLHRAKLEALGAPIPRLLHGDSRNFAQIVQGAAGICTSPPFLATEGGCKPRMGGTIDKAMMDRHNATADVRYGTSEGQIGQLPAGDVSSIVTSPPYAESDHNGGYGDQMKNMAVRYQPKNRGKRPLTDKSEEHRHYGTSPGQIGNLKPGDLQAVVTSPPYISGGHHPDQTGAWGGQAQANDKAVAGYGQTEGQIGRDSGETYWAAMRTVYQQCLLALPPGGYLACVVKSYVKNKTLVNLPDQTFELLLNLGFEPVERAKAWLTKTSTSLLLDGSEKVTVKKRASFFRRLAEAKGSPAIDWEDVLFVRKPAKSP